MLEPRRLPTRSRAKSALSQNDYFASASGRSTSEDGDDIVQQSISRSGRNSFSQGVRRKRSSFNIGAAAAGRRASSVSRPTYGRRHPPSGDVGFVPQASVLEQIIVGSLVLLVIKELWQMRIGSIPPRIACDPQWHAMFLFLLYFASLLIQALYLIPFTAPSKLWLTPMRFYRSGADDGLIYAVLLSPTTLAANAIRIHRHNASHTLIPYVLASLELSFLTSLSVLVHTCCTKLGFLPEFRARKRYLFIASAGLSIVITLILSQFAATYFPLLSQAPMLHTFIPLLTFQICAYCTTIFLRRSFTFGEMAMAGCGLTALTAEALTLTVHKLRWYDLPTWMTFQRDPIAIYVLALALGMSVIGFISWPVLMVSRRRAGLTRRKRQLNPPQWYHLDKTVAALIFYGLTGLIVLFGIRPWVQAFLPDKADPFLFAWQYILEGGIIRWTLIIVWGAGITSSILLFVQLSGATTLSSKRQSVYADSDDDYLVAKVEPPSLGDSSSNREDQSAVFSGSSDLDQRDSSSALLAGSGATSTSSTLNTSKQRRVRTAVRENGTRSSTTRKVVIQRWSLLKYIASMNLLSSLNARRKYFHFLALLLFFPGMIYDPSFTSLAFGVAFAAFIFVEYVRFFALWPAGRDVHLFLTAFQDAKDQGVVILAHFYLLVGCGVTLWMGYMSGPEPRYHLQTSLLALSGVLTLGLGDSMASIIGKRYGKHKWPRSKKTLEGSASFVLFCLVGATVASYMIQGFNPDLWNYTAIAKYVGVVAFVALLEASVGQNDNLIIPMIFYDYVIVLSIV